MKSNIQPIQFDFEKDRVKKIKCLKRVCALHCLHCSTSDTVMPPPVGATGAFGDDDEYDDDLDDNFE